MPPLKMPRFIMKNDRVKAFVFSGVLAIGYGTAFFLAHWSAAIWGGTYFFSLFYPAAGVRFAVLWHLGLRRLPLVVLTELAVQLISLRPSAPEALDVVVGVMRAPLAYGFAIALIRWIVKRASSDLTTPPMPFALASVLAPITASLSYLSWNVIKPSHILNPSTEPVVTASIAFMVGDLLGVLLVAPVLLLLAELRSGHRPAWTVSPWQAGEAVIFFAFGWAFAMAAKQVSPSLMLTPIMLTTAWIGLRCGRVAAWLTISLVAVIALPISHTAADIPTRLAHHIGMAGVAISGYLAGSYSDALRRAHLDIERRDRLLFQAERLKTLRAMSVAVIHEISQPLSTLSIESRYLAELGSDPMADRTELGEIAALVERKVGALSDMVRRLRRFGGRAVAEPSPIAVRVLLHDMAALVQAEAQKAGNRLELGETPLDMLVIGQDVELLQALVNLVRNAIAAAPGGAISISAERKAGEVVISIANGIATNAPSYGGMGVGTLIARAIAEAHGGQIARTDLPDGRVLHRFSMPCLEPTHA